MSFDTIEASNQDGKPVELYEFSQGFYPNNRVWYFTTADRDIVAPASLSNTPTGSATYLAIAISNGGIEINGGSEENESAITMPLDNPVAQLFNGTPPAVYINVTIRRMHHEDNEAPIYWMGFIGSRAINNDGEAILNCSSLIATFTRGGLRLCWERQCPHPLYAPTTCKAVKVPITCTVDALTGNSVTSEDFILPADGKLAGGYIEWSIAGTLMENRAIDTHNGDVITLLGATDGMTVGMTITAFIGCGRDRISCDTDHSNLPNHGGYPHMPGKSPFDGDPVF
jgi:hypothetical protein